MHRAGRPEPSIRVAGKTEQIREITKQAEEGRVIQYVHTRAEQEGFLASVIVPRTSSTRDITVLETAMQGLALDAWHPVALELAATASSRHFLLRATSAMSLKHLADQVQARYPQAIIRPQAQEDDPLVQVQKTCCGTYQQGVRPSGHTTHPLPYLDRDIFVC